MSIRVVVADDDADVLAAMCALLEDDPRFDVVAGVGTGPDAVTATHLHSPDAVLLDARMPGGGIDAAHAVRAISPTVTIVAISAQVDATLVAAMLHAGAGGVLAKGRIGGSLPDLVARCCAGELVLATPAGSDGLRQLSALRVSPASAVREPEPHGRP